MFSRPLSSLITLSILTAGGLSVKAQRTVPSPSPKEPQVKVAPTQPDKALRAPQVVTVVHRLNGLKMFRLLMRSEQEVNAISAFEPRFDLFQEVHTNVIAGLALEDGETIAAWLPEAEVEVAASEFDFPKTNSPAVKADRNGRAARQQFFPNELFPPPDITVIGADGRSIPVKYVGLDGATGLSILRLSSKDSEIAQPPSQDGASVGQNVRLFGPEPVKSAPSLSRGLYVRVGVIPGEIRVVTRGPAGVVSRLRVKSSRLSEANIGGVAVNEDGSTVGIVDAIEGDEASILPADLIRIAAKRVLDQKRSVPRPWLGVRGEAMSMDQLLNHGWTRERARAFASEHKGIMLTSITPGSPAAVAALREGDVILKINDSFVNNPEDFSWFMEQMGPDRLLSFTLARPDKVTEELISVELNRTAPVRSRGLRSRGALAAQGVETIEMRQPGAARLGAANAGLLVVFVQPASPAFAAGLQPGDLIEKIDGKPGLPAAPLQLAPDTKITLTVIRQKQRVEVTIKGSDPI